jgi:hypothetical protein
MACDLHVMSIIYTLYAVLSVVYVCCLLRRYPL